MKKHAWGLPAYYFAILALLYLPLLILLIFAFNDGFVLAFPIRGLTLRWFRALFETEALMRALRNSIAVGATSSAFATLLATCGALGFVRYRFRGRQLFMSIGLLPLYVPFVVLGVALLLLFMAVGVPRSLLTVGAAHVVVSLPYALLIIVARLSGLDPDLEEAAMSLGANPWKTLRHVTLPLTAPAIVAAALTAFTVSFDEFALANLLTEREPTLPVYLYSQLRMSPRLPLVIAMSALIMLGTLSIFFTLVLLYRVFFAQSKREKEGA